MLNDEANGGRIEKGERNSEEKALPVSEERFLVIMAVVDEMKPTFLATPTSSCSRVTSCFYMGDVGTFQSTQVPIPVAGIISDVDRLIGESIGITQCVDVDRLERSISCGWPSSFGGAAAAALSVAIIRNQMQSIKFQLLLPAQESYFFLRLLCGSFQIIESLKAQISLYCSNYSFDLIESTCVNSIQNEKEISDGGGQRSGAVFNVLDALLKGSLDRLKALRENISWVQTGGCGAILETDYISDITLIRSLCLEGKLGAAAYLWTKMVEHLRLPDIVTHNYLLNALSLCKSGDLGKAEWLVREMIFQGPFPTCATFNTLLKGYCLVNKVDKALDLFYTMDNHGIRPNRVSCNILVHDLCQKGLLEDARKLLEKILGDDNDGETSELIHSTILMDGYFKTEKTLEALACWNEVFQRGIEADVVAYNVIINGCSTIGDMKCANKSLCQMFKSGYLPDVVTYNTLIGKLCKSGRINEACYVFGDMSMMGVASDHITYKMIIQGLCINGDAVRANNFLSHMLEYSIRPDPLIFNVIIQAFGKCGDIHKALSVRNQMVELGILPNIYTYNALIHAQIKNGNIDQVHYLRKEMILHDVFPDLVTYNMLIGVACNIGLSSSALQLHNEMLKKGCDPDIVTYTILLKHYCLRGSMKKAEELFLKVLWSGLRMDRVPFLLLMKRYFKMRELDKVSYLHLVWLKKGI
ncbi:uncharacterized protein [Primulina huaijiensis]|uniref:uncharacterized protein n=1 Tax=Primulina huaijiensis TaxID=1492673 RepID=UPI003CC736F2